MSSKKIAKKYLSEIGFKDSDIDDDYETDFMPALIQPKGGVIFVEHSCRFDNFNKVVKHIEKELKIKANVIERGEEVYFNINHSNFESLVLYKENDMIKIYLQKK